MAGGSGRNYDIVVIGGGPGGYVAAIRAAQLGLKVAIVERDALGGVCLNWGCIPSKALLWNAEVLTLFHRAREFGIRCDNLTADYGSALARCRAIVATQVKGVQFLMHKNGIDVVHGQGSLLGNGRVRVADDEGIISELHGEHIILATGARVKPLPGVALDGTHIVSAKEVWRVETLPRSVLIVGGGAIGVEFATVYRAYGCAVTIVEYLPRLVPLEDEDVSAALTRSFVRRGITVLTATKVDHATVVGDRVVVGLSPVAGGESVQVNAWETQAPQRQTTAGGGATRTVEVDRVLLGAGFLPNSEHLGLEALGVRTERGFIVVDEAMRTSVPGVSAIGDVTGLLPLAHVASAQGEYVAELIAGQSRAPLDYDAMPRCIYSTPQIAAMGKTEAQARAGGREVRVGSFPFRPNGKAQALGETDGLAKIITDAHTGEILGAHLVGPDVTELIAELALARALEATPTELARTVHPHPTLSEVIGEAARSVEGLAIHR